MRKVLVSLVALVACFTFVLPSGAQLISFGLKGGINNTEMSFDKEVFNSSKRYGWFVGPALRIKLPIVGLDFAAMYDQKETKFNGRNIQQRSVVVPVNLRTQFGFGSLVGIYLAAGPQLEFNVGKSTFTWEDRNDILNSLQLAESNFSVNLGAGAYLTKHFEVGFTYNMAIGKTSETTFENAVKSVTSDDSKAKTWTITAAFYF